MAYTKEQRKEYDKKRNAERKEFLRERDKRRHIEIREWFVEYKSHLKCERCPESHHSCLDFHHEDPNEKEITISRAIASRWSKDRIIKEIEKCSVLCANCHRKLHNELLRR